MQVVERRREQAAEVVERRREQAAEAVERRREQAAEAVEPRLERRPSVIWSFQMSDKQRRVPLFTAKEGRRTLLAQINQVCTNLVQKRANPVQFQTGTISAPALNAALNQRFLKNQRNKFLACYLL